MYCLSDIVRFQGRRRPHHVALVFSDRRLTYGELDTYVDHLAGTLRRKGLNAGERVGMLAHNSDRFVGVFLALQRLGAVPVLLNFRSTITDCKKLADRTSCVGVIHDMSSESVSVHMVDVPSMRWESRILDQVFEPSPDACRGQEPISVELTDDHEALIFFTSGTQADPKAVVHSRGGLKSWLGLQASSEWTITARDVSLVYPPLFHLGGMQIVLHSLVAGATVVIVDRYDAAEILSLAEAEHVTQLCIIPPPKILEIAETQAVHGHDLSSVTLVLLLGGVNRERYCEAVFSTFVNASFMHALGHSENAATCTIVMNREEYLAKPEHRTSLGQLAACSLIRLVDDAGHDVPDETPGTVLATSPAMMAGYLGVRPERDDGWFKTGDVLRRDSEGYYFYVDRLGFMIKSGGENVAPAEVEAALLTHPYVTDCAVFGSADEVYGEIVTAAIVLTPGSPKDAEAIVQHCREQIAPFKRPRKVIFLDELPRTALGKVAKAELIKSSAP